MPHLSSWLSILVSGGSREEHHGKIQVAEHGLHFSLEEGKSSLIALDGFRVIFQTDAALVG